MILEIFHIAAGKESQEWSRTYWRVLSVMKLSPLHSLYTPQLKLDKRENKIISGNYLRGIPPSKYNVAAEMQIKRICSHQTDWLTFTKLESEIIKNSENFFQKEQAKTCQQRSSKYDGWCSSKSILGILTFLCSIQVNTIEKLCSEGNLLFVIMCLKHSDNYLKCPTKSLFSPAWLCILSARAPSKA